MDPKDPRDRPLWQDFPEPQLVEVPLSPKKSEDNPFIPPPRSPYRRPKPAPKAN